MNKPTDGPKRVRRFNHHVYRFLLQIPSNLSGIIIARKEYPILKSWLMDIGQHGFYDEYFSGEEFLEKRSPVFSRGFGLDLLQSLPSESSDALTDDSSDEEVTANNMQKFSLDSLEFFRTNFGRRNSNMYYGNDFDKVKLHMDKASSHTSKSTAAYLAKKESETGIKCIRFDEMHVKSPYASAMDFCAFV
ncbi:uncharacterized protein TNCV_2416521 [Trichonephila clavipes]|nr:uncharacterized protein TNCV_2416521 [Trichonephila clavipes]